MSDVSVFVAFVGGVVFGALIMGVFVGSIAHTNFEKYTAMRATAFGLEEMLLDALEGNTDKQWMMVAEGGADPIVVRKRPDLDRSIRIAEHEEGWVRHGEPNLIDLTGVEDD